METNGTWNATSRNQNTDFQAEDRRRLGLSIWLLLQLEIWTPSSDSLVRSGASIRAQELASAMGVGERQARRELQRLRGAGYVELQNTGRGFKIRLVGRSRFVGAFQ
jgi:hypothetical protein